MKNTLIAIECKFNSTGDGFSGDVGKNFEVFRDLYPDGQNFKCLMLKKLKF